ncbi:putative pectinesterase/pectinesterase inhibitor 26 [Platanthera guangdongensis]|uniref:Pectinesterase/pectinesterase inhibitor 26 n=1 Tax=Platanthera guangdongensis TaxID=2320717 RepID=A0ABR2LMR7_9ASPA
MLPSTLPLFLLLPLLSIAAAGPLEDTCQAISASRPDLTSNLCITALSADPACHSADRRGLAIIAARISIANATNISIIIHRLMDAGTDPMTANCLSVCLDVYSDAVDHLRDAADGINSGKYDDAVTFLSAAVDAAENCEDAFGDEGMSSPVAEEDRRFERMAEIALAIAANLK